jgi:hypothetical protein
MIVITHGCDGIPVHIRCDHSGVCALVGVNIPIWSVSKMAHTSSQATPVEGRFVCFTRVELGIANRTKTPKTMLRMSRVMIIFWMAFISLPLFFLCFEKNEPSGFWVPEGLIG